MFEHLWVRRVTAAVVGVAALGLSINAFADDVVSFATGGYAHAIRGKTLFQKIDTNGDGMISRDEWLAFQEQVFAMLDPHKTGTVDAAQFTHGTGDVATLATGGFARELRTADMMHKIDTDADGTVSHDEFITFQSRIFDMMDVSTKHKGLVGRQDIMIATGGAATGR